MYLIITAALNLALRSASPGGVGPFEVTTRELVYFGTPSASASAYALMLHRAPQMAITEILGAVGDSASLGQVLGGG